MAAALPTTASESLSRLLTERTLSASSPALPGSSSAGAVASNQSYWPHGCRQEIGKPDSGSRRSADLLPMRFT